MKKLAVVTVTLIFSVGLFYSCQDIISSNEGNYSETDTIDSQNSVSQSSAYKKSIPKGIFEYIENESKLTKIQIDLLSKIVKRERTKESHIVRIQNLSSIKDKSDILFNLPDRSRVEAKAKRIKSEENWFSWRGITKQFPSTVSITATGESAFGRIKTPDHHYDIDPLGKGLHVLRKIESNIDFNDDAIEITSGDYEPEHIESMLLDPVIKVMVLYTDDVNNTVGTNNIDELISHLEDDTNSSFTNSQINLTIEVVHTEEVNYSETGNPLLDLCRLTTSPSFTPPECSGLGNLGGYIEEIHETRYQEGANLVVMLGSWAGSMAGIAWQNATSLGGPEYGFSYVHYDQRDDYVFAHEIGHNIGAHHDRPNGTNQHYDYGHGYRYTAGGWRTIMAYQPQIAMEYWSNPFVDLNSVAMGTQQYENNARVWNERGPIVASFQPPSPYLQTYIDGPNSIQTSQYVEFEAITSGGETPYSYQWQIDNGTGTGPWQDVGTDASFYGHTSYSSGTFYLRVIVTDNNNEDQTSIIHYVTVQ